MPDPFDDSRRLTGSNFFFTGVGAALETARGLAFDDATLDRWRANVRAARAALGWPDAEIVIRRHRSGASLAFVAPMDQLYAATEVNEWAWRAALEPRINESTPQSADADAPPFSPREKVPEGRMREPSSTAGEATRRKLQYDDETLAFVRNLRANATDAEQLIWSCLRDRRLHGQKFRRQKTLGPYVLDFYCHELKLAIELDGGQHNEAAARENDEKRDAFVAGMGLLTLRYWNHDVMAHTEDVLADIWARVDAAMVEAAARSGGAPSSALRAPSPGGRREVQEGLSAAAGEGDRAAGPLDVPEEKGSEAESVLASLKALADAEARPALLALRDAAAQRGLPFLPDDDAISIGGGEGSWVWPIDALPAVDDVDWSSLHAIPTALVTGSNGKTTTVRLIAAMTRAHGWHTAHSCTDGVFFDGTALESGDFSGPMGARAAMRQPQAQAAILEAARGGMLRRGLALDHAQVAVVTNISPDHFGEYGIHDLDDLATVKLTVARAIREDGLLVLNADDPILVRQSAAMRCPIGWFALDLDMPLLVAHRAAGGVTCGVRDGRLVLAGADGEHDLGAIAAMPLTLAGRATYNVGNAAAASLAARALGVPADTIASVLARFGSGAGDNPGRLQHWRFGALDIYVDYAHNPEGLHSLLRAIGADARGARRMALLLGHAGNREDEDLRAVASTGAAYAPQLVVLKDIVGGYERGRASGEVAGIMRGALLDAGVPAAAIDICLDEVAAARRPLAWARDGDLIVLPVHEPDARVAVVAMLDTLRALDWRPGQPLPPLDRTPP